MKNLLTSLAKCTFVLLRLTAAVSATDVAIQKKDFGSETTILIISNEEMDGTVKIVEDS